MVLVVGAALWISPWQALPEFPDECRRYMEPDSNTAGDEPAYVFIGTMAEYDACNVAMMARYTDGSGTSQLIDDPTYEFDINIEFDFVDGHVPGTLRMDVPSDSDFALGSTHILFIPQSIDASIGFSDECSSIYQDVALSDEFYPEGGADEWIAIGWFGTRSEYADCVAELSH